MDNAPDHNMFLEDGVPPLSSKKGVLQQWLHEKNIFFDTVGDGKLHRCDAAGRGGRGDAAEKETNSCKNA
jgi:hypothetical protein